MNITIISKLFITECDFSLFSFIGIIGFKEIGSRPVNFTIGFIVGIFPCLLLSIFNFIILPKLTEYLSFTLLILQLFVKNMPFKFLFIISFSHSILYSLSKGDTIYLILVKSIFII